MVQVAIVIAFDSFRVIKTISPLLFIYPRFGRPARMAADMNAVARLR
jgi:hypothetical protein